MSNAYTSGAILEPVERGHGNAPTIAQLNDEFRRTPDEVWLTPGVHSLPDVPGLIAAVRQFDTFTEDNDPYGEHDFGSITWHGGEMFWKIDYYDQALKYWHDPLDAGCHRVLTLLLASEY